jgi:hypothetical protein
VKYFWEGNQVDYTQLKSINIHDCEFKWMYADGTECGHKWDASQTVFGAVFYKGKVVHHDARPYCYISDAWQILRLAKRAKWKSAKMMVTLRQAIREVNAQGMPLAIPKAGIGEKHLKTWLTIARQFDAVHHGVETF